MTCLSSQLTIIWFIFVCILIITGYIKYYWIFNPQGIGVHLQHLRSNWIVWALLGSIFKTPFHARLHHILPEMPLTMMLFILLIVDCSASYATYDISHTFKSIGPEFIVGHSTPSAIINRKDNTNCNYDILEHCGDRKNSTIVRTDTYNGRGEITEGTHVHYNNPANVDYRMRADNPPIGLGLAPLNFDGEVPEQSGELRGGMTAHFANEPPVDGEDSGITKRNRYRAENRADRPPYFDIHKYDSDKNKTIYYDAIYPYFAPLGR